MTPHRASTPTDKSVTAEIPGNSAVYLPGLDGIRALAIALVLLSHSVIYDDFPRFKATGLQCGYAGVALFFVLSGYLITRLLLGEEARASTISLRRFYLRRALRLFPALWLFLLVVALLCLARALPPHPWHSFVASLFYVRNLVGRGHETEHLWSLSLEEQFYIFWPLLLIAFRHVFRHRDELRRNQLRLIAAAALLLIVASWRYLAATQEWASLASLYRRTDFRFDAPLAGCILALTEANCPRFFSNYRQAPRFAEASFGVGLLLMALWIALARENALSFALGPLILSIAGTLLIFSQIGAPNRTSIILASAPAIALGKISYGVYLWQQLFLGHRGTGLTSLRFFPIGLVLTFVVAGLSYYYLERPLLKLKNRKFQ